MLFLRKQAYGSMYMFIVCCIYTTLFHQSGCITGWW